VQPSASPPGGDAGDRGEGWRVAGLIALLFAFSTISTTVLIGLPFVLLVLLLPARRFGALLLAALMLVLIVGGSGTSGLWYAERGWGMLVGGWFAALTLRRPEAPVSQRAMLSALGATGTAIVYFAVRPMAWGVVDWRVAERIRLGVRTTLEAIEALRGEAVSPTLVDAVQATAETQAQLFPALVALASMAGLGVAWWLYTRLALGRRGALGPLAQFRFNDQWVWLFVGGLLALILGFGELWTRAGSNAVLFMGALYALRGAAVVLFVNGGISALGVVTLALGMMFLAPVILAGALVIGLGDTWLDIRTRASRTVDAGR
jgi:hypothetical protein